MASVGKSRTRSSKRNRSVAIVDSALAQAAGVSTGSFIQDKFIDPAEQVAAQKLLGLYVSQYELANISEQNLVQDLIYLEVVQARLQARLNEEYDSDIKALPFDLLDLIHKNGDAIVKLKNSLGLNKAKATEAPYDAFQHLKQRLARWGQENQASLTHKCPSCQQFVMFWLRRESWEARQHPWFRDNMVFNKHLFAHRGQRVLIDDEFLAAVLETSVDYIQWVVAKAANGTQTNQETIAQPGAAVAASDPVVASTTHTAS